MCVLDVWNAPHRVALPHQTANGRFQYAPGLEVSQHRPKLLKVLSTGAVGMFLLWA